MNNRFLKTFYYRLYSLVFGFVVISVLFLYSSIGFDDDKVGVKIGIT